MYDFGTKYWNWKRYCEGNSGYHHGTVIFSFFYAIMHEYKYKYKYKYYVLMY